MAFDRTQMKISSLVERIDNKEIRLPEIQRDYVWKSHQIAKLLDSLYRQYPSGSLLLWETHEEVVERDVRSAVSGSSTFRPLYLLDGQQRLTSLHRVLHGHADAEVVFNIVTEKFQLASAATRKDKRWLRVHDILAGKVKAADKRELVEQLDAAVDEDVIDERITRVARITDYEYHVEIVRGLPYVEVTDIFVRVNSRGKNLTRSDLALATLTAKYPGFYEKLKARADANRKAGYPKLGVSTLVRALAVFGTPVGTLEGMAAATTAEIDDGWRIVERGVEHLIPLLKHNLDLGNDTLLPSANALIPLVGYLGLRDKEALSTPAADALLYWLLIALLTSHYSSAVDTKLAQDRAALNGNDPMLGLYSNLGLTQRFRLTTDMLVGRSTDSAAFMLSYIIARRQDAHDWWTAAKIGVDGAGHFRIEHHHVHPQATLKKFYTKAQVNDIANYAFISEAANKKISARSPQKYFPQVGDEELRRHYIPLDEHLRDASRYTDFLAGRRALLVVAINEVLDGYAPKTLEKPSAFVTPAGPQVALQVFADVEPEEGLLRVTCNVNDSTWEGDLAMRDLLIALEEVAEGIATQLEPTDGVVLPFDVDEDVVSVQLGPIRLDGTLEEWRRVVDRELSDVTPSSDAGHARPWQQPDAVTARLSVLECE